MRISTCARFLAPSFFVLVACSRHTDTLVTPAASSSVAAPNATLALGERISLPVVSLVEIAKNPSRYENTLIATAGKVTAVCQEMGCWMELKDESGDAHVKMHGHTFFVPKTASGHVARVQAKVLSGNVEHCEESPPPQHALAHVELDATGVEID